MESDPRDLENELDKCHAELKGSADEWQVPWMRKHSMNLANLIVLACRLSFGSSQPYLTLDQLVFKVPGLPPPLLHRDFRLT